MNLDAIFAGKVYQHPDSRKYFIEINSEVVGTKIFFMDYHNCVDNLWLITTEANTGTGKDNQDPIVWLGEQKDYYGDEFFKGYYRVDSLG